MWNQPYNFWRTDFRLTVATPCLSNILESRHTCSKFVVLSVMHAHILFVGMLLQNERDFHNWKIAIIMFVVSHWFCSPRDNRGNKMNNLNACSSHSYLYSRSRFNLTGMVTCVPPYETFSLIKKIFFVILKSTKITSKIQIFEVCHDIFLIRLKVS
jgi:hypothetical protein